MIGGAGAVDSPAITGGRGLKLHNDAGHKLMSDDSPAITGGRGLKHPELAVDLQSD